MVCYCRYVEKKIAAILPLMLPDDTSTRVIMMTSQICARLAHDKVLLWMGAHITKCKSCQLLASNVILGL